MEIITSLNNKIVKYTCSLKEKKARKQEGLFIAEGERLVLDAIKIKMPEYLIISENYEKKDFDCKNYVVSESVFKKISDTVSPQGIIGVFKTDFKKIEDIKDGNIIILNNVSDPGNVGTILRTANAAGFSNVVVDSGCVDIYNPKTVRSSMSALFNENIYYSDNLINDIELIKEKGYDVIGTYLDSDSCDIYSNDFKSPVAVVVGNEANGIDKGVIDLCDKKIIIPMKSDIESLNVSVAASIVMYEILRREEYEN